MERRDHAADTRGTSTEARDAEAGDQGACRAVPESWTGSRTAYPRDRGIAELFAEVAAGSPDAVAVVAGERAVSYRELDRLSECLAERLRRLGVSRSEPVLVALERSLELVLALLGVIKAGGAYVPLDASYPRERLAFMARDAGGRVLVTREALLERLPVGPAVLVLGLDEATRGTGTGGDRRGAGEGGPAPAASGAGDLAYVTYTSGSTGRPKGVAVPQRGVVRLVRDTDYARFGPEETFLHLAAVTFDLTTLEVWGPLLAGGRLVVFPPEAPTPDRLAEVLARERVTFLWLTAGLFHQVADTRPEALGPVRQLLAGGDALSAVHCRRVLETNPATVLIDGYGPTENTTFSSCHAMCSPDEVRDPVSIGRPVANSTAYVVDAFLEAEPVGGRGELAVGGDGLAWGYWRRPALSAERFVPDAHGSEPGGRLYRTGDLARWLPDGTLEFHGRVDHQVKLRGFRIEPGEVRSVLSDHPGVADALVTVRDEPGGRVLVAYVVPLPGAERPQPRELRTHAAELLPEYMVPAAFVVLDGLPLSPTGKVDRSALPAPGPEDRASAEEHVPPRTELERTLAGIWSEVLGVHRPGLADDFFALGGHSLLAGSILSRVREVLGADLPVGLLFRARTLGAFAREIAARRDDAPAVDRPIRPAGARRPGGADTVPLTPGQRGLWLIEQQQPGVVAYNLPVAFRLCGPLSASDLARALGEVVRRHEVLRAQLLPGGGGDPVQAVRPAAPVALPVVDLSGLPEERRDGAERTVVAAEAGHPFVLAGEPLVRSLLVALDAGRHTFLFHAHHAVFDGWSAEVLARELRALYAAAAAGETAALPEPPIQFRDYALWLRERESGEAFDGEIDSWRRHLESLPPVLQLPSDRPRPRAVSYRGGEVGRRIGPRLSEELGALGRAEGATRFMTVLAAFVGLLGRWTGRSELPVGSPVAGRERPELEGLIGLFVNVLVLRCDLGGEPTFRELVARVRDETLTALAHDRVPFQRLVEVLDPDRTSAHHPVVQVLFAGQELDPLAGELAPGVSMEPELLATGGSRVDLTLFADRRAGGFDLRFEYSTDLFDRTSVERLARHLEVLLGAAAEAPDRPVAQLPVLDRGERQALLREWRGRGSSYPRDAGLGALFERQVRRRPDAVAVAAGVEQVSYGGLARRADALARRLGAAGVRRGSPVALALERSADLVAGVLGVIRAGGAYLSLDPEYPDARLRFLVEDAGARVLATDGAVLERLGPVVREAGLSVVRVDRPAGELPASRPEPAGPEDAACLIYTSGSTGRPKGVVVSQRGVARLVLEPDFAEPGPEETGLLLAPISFDAATLELWEPLLNGGRLAVYPAGQPGGEELAGVLAEERVTTLFLTVGLFHQLADEAPQAPAPLRRLMTGGDVVSPDACRRVLARNPGLILSNAYGPTENATLTSCHRMRRPENVRAPVPIGRPIADTEVLVLDPRLEPTPTGVYGELVTGGDGLATGYWRRPARSAEAFVPHPWGRRPGSRLYRTGDLVRWRPDGTLDFLGRKDGQVKVRGFRIEVGEVEAALGSHPEVAVAAVAARRAPGGDDKVLAAYVATAGPGSLDPAALRSWLANRLPPHMVPGVVVPLDELPLDPNGKVDRRALPDPGELPGPGGASRRPPRSETEQAVAAIWEEVLHRDGLALEDDFFALGGQSLSGARVVSRIRARLGKEVSMTALFAAPCLGDFARKVAEAPVASRTSRPGPIRRASRRR
ncbi:MAG: amino acid adenylation domain-containing protein [Thermoanaerobaculia bacterium]